MFASMKSPSQAYARIDVETGVMGADPHKLILMLLDGAIMRIASAVHALNAGNIAAKGESISWAIDIISNGLKASLDFSADEEIASRLAALYDYMCERLLYANLRNDAAALNEVSQLLGEIKSGWEAIANDPAVLSRINPAS